MELEELMAFIIQERLNCFSREQGEEKREEMRRKCEEWEQFLQSGSEELAEKNQIYLNWLMIKQGEEVEEAYRFGVRDGVRLLKMLDMI